MNDDPMQPQMPDPVVDQLSLIAKGVQAHSPAVARTCRDAIETITRLRLDLWNARNELNRERQLADRIAQLLGRDRASERQ